MFRVEVSGERLTIYLDDKPVIAHSPDEPFAHAGKGRGRLSDHGKPSDQILEKAALTRAQYDAARSCVRFFGGDFSLTFRLSESEGNLALTPQRATTGLNRLWLSFPAHPGACVYGGGAQTGGLDLRGQRIPLWVREKLPGTGTKENARSAGHHASFFPLPTFVTQDLTFVTAEDASFVTMDFKNSRYHRMEFWEIPSVILIGTANTSANLMRKMTRLTGRQAVLPAWALEGTCLEVSGGMQKLLSRLEKVVNVEASVSSLWIRDWSGSRETRDGRRIFFDWVANLDLYPKLPELIRELANRNIRALAYINPHLSIEGRLFAEASMRGYLIKKPEGGSLVTDMGGFMVGHLDLSSRDACAWYKELIKKNILEVGFRGYVADMGDYLPVNAVLANGESPLKMHNKWPIYWARLNREAVREAGRATDTVVFNRSGFGGSNGWAMLASVGETMSGWGKEDGLAAALCAQLGLSWSGMGLSHTCVRGGEPFLSKRSKELFLRWLELAAFSPVLCITDGEADGLQVDSDPEILAHVARMTRIHAKLGDYMRSLVKENAGEGIPVMRPLSMCFPEETVFLHTSDAYMLGPELLVAPIVRKGQSERRVMLPQGQWIHLWTGREHSGGETEVYAPIGKPPVFYRPSGRFASLFDSFANM